VFITVSTKGNIDKSGEAEVEVEVWTTEERARVFMVRDVSKVILPLS
jgi:hypothetical protein